MRISGNTVVPLLAGVFATGALLGSFTLGCGSVDVGSAADAADNSCLEPPCSDNECAADQMCDKGCDSDPDCLATSCVAIRNRVPDAVDGVYTIDPDGREGVSPFEVYCDMVADGGGWTLIGKYGAGSWPELSVIEYTDLIANPVSDVNPTGLLEGALPEAKEVAFFNKAKTNALYHNSPLDSNPVVRVRLESTGNPAASGTYFQQRRVVDPAWDFWAAMRDSRRWNRNNLVTGEWVDGFGLDFVLSGNPSDFDQEKNTVAHAGDGSFFWWDEAILNLNDSSTLAVSRHMGLLCDGYENQGNQWIATLKPSDERFMNEDNGNRTTIWLR